MIFERPTLHRFAKAAWFVWFLYLCAEDPPLWPLFIPLSLVWFLVGLKNPKWTGNKNTLFRFFMWLVVVPSIPAALIVYFWPFYEPSVRGEENHAKWFAALVLTGLWIVQHNMWAKEERDKEHREMVERANTSFDLQRLIEMDRQDASAELQELRENLQEYREKLRQLEKELARMKRKSPQPEKEQDSD